MILVSGAIGLVLCLMLDPALSGRWRYPPTRVGPRTGGALAAVAVRGGGLLAVIATTIYGALTRDGPSDQIAVVSLGTLALAAFLCLAVSGFFGYGSAGRRDWVALIPLGAALVVREIFTLHSVQEIEIQFAQGPVGRHAIVYPLLQLFFAPLVRDPHRFTMHMNGVMGAAATLSLYLASSYRFTDPAEAAIDSA